MRLSYIMLYHGGIKGFELLCDWVLIQQPFLFSPAAALVAMVRASPTLLLLLSIPIPKFQVGHHQDEKPCIFS